MHKAVVVLILSLFSFSASAAPKVNEAEEMGHLAGTVLACRAHRSLYQFEEILSRYFSNTAFSPDAEKAKIREYARAKADTFSIYKNRKNDCSAIVNDFTRMPIFKTELYSDGSLRMPDGKFLYPRGQKKLAPDAKKIYPE